jgi:hypothetical protein
MRCQCLDDRRSATIHHDHIHRFSDPDVIPLRTKFDRSASRASRPASVVVIRSERSSSRSHGARTEPDVPPGSVRALLVPSSNRRVTKAVVGCETDGYECNDDVIRNGENFGSRQEPTPNTSSVVLVRRGLQPLPEQEAAALVARATRSHEHGSHSLPDPRTATPSSTSWSTATTPDARLGWQWRTTPYSRTPRPRPRPRPCSHAHVWPQVTPAAQSR